MVMHPNQVCTPSPPLGSGQVPLLESGSHPRSLEPRSQLSFETEAQVGGVDVEPSNSSPDLGFVRQKWKWTSLRRRSHPNAHFGSP